MLVLSRRLGERILLPDLGVTVEVVGLRPGAVRLGISAPDGLLVLREELLHRAPEGGPPPRAPRAGPDCREG
jgi:carbon storage regulator CsrA